MVSNRKRKQPERGRATMRDYEAAKRLVDGGMSKLKACEMLSGTGLKRSSFYRYLDKVKKSSANNSVVTMGYNKDVPKILPLALDRELSDHLVKLSDKFHGLTCSKVKCLAFQFATANNVQVPGSWSTKSRAGKDWLRLFMKRNKLAIRKPEATSLARSTAFNKETTSNFFSNLAQVMDKYKFVPSQIWNADETGTKTVQTPNAIIDAKGKRQVGATSSGERGELVTTICAVNAEGRFIPPCFIFPRTRYQNIFLRGAPSGSLGFATKSGWINDDIWFQFLKHFAAQACASKQKPALLVIDNHSSHINIDAVNFASDNGIILLTVWPHTTHKMQPLDVSVYGPFKHFYNNALDSWMRNHPGERFTIYHVAAAVNEAFLSAMTPRNIISGFRATGICPYNPNIFNDSDFVSCLTEYEGELEETDDPRHSYHIERSAAQDAAQPSSVTSLQEWLNCDQHDDRHLSSEEFENLLGTAEPSTSSRTTPSQEAVNPGAQQPSTSIAATPDTSNETNSTADVSPVSLFHHVSPQVFYPLPKATQRKKTGRQGSSKILTATPQKARLEALSKKKKENISRKNKPALVKKLKKVKNSKAKDKTQQTTRPIVTRRKLIEEDDTSFSEDETLISSMRDNFEGNTSDEYCEEVDSDFPLQPKGGEVWKCCFCNEKYADSRSGEKWVRCTCSNAAHDHLLLKEGDAEKFICCEWAHELCCDDEKHMICVNCS